MKILDRAVRVFGLTDDPAEAGYLLPDGSFLDFSGSREGGPHGQRAYDHRQIEVLFPHVDEQVSRWVYMYRFMKLGAIRIYTNVGIDRRYLFATFVTRPTKQQLRVIAQLARQTEDVTLEIVDRNAETVRSFSASFPQAYEILEWFESI